MKKSIPTPWCWLRRETLVLLVGSILGLAACIPGISVAASSGGASSARSQEFPMKIRMHVDGQVVTATLYDNATARDFAVLLPLSLTLEDYAVIEQISNLPRKLSTADAPAGMKPETGDITYYAPWGNLAIFASGNVLLPLGKVDTGLPALQRPGPLKVRIERITD
jgi:hypothetical protein